MLYGCDSGKNSKDTKMCCSIMNTFVKILFRWICFPFFLFFCLSILLHTPPPLPVTLHTWKGIELWVCRYVLLALMIHICLQYPELYFASTFLHHVSNSAESPRSSYHSIIANNKGSRSAWEIAASCCICEKYNPDNWMTLVQKFIMLNTAWFT